MQLKSLIALGSLSICLYINSVSYAQEQWIFFEEGSEGKRYIERDFKPGTDVGNIRTLLDLKETETVVIQGKKYFYRSVEFSTFFHCTNYSRHENHFVFYTDNMGTGTRIGEISQPPTHYQPYFYSYAEWERNGYGKRFCKKIWEIWR